ncbi:YbjQ family protein [Paenibacillus taiwanensis]|uniref:YbjQ family protein n=1 Tax=Paenibacillus taiwanensis TaxID=401638 RepID=UPI000420BA48|nr:heavy metal-binding domain-containing protein [Paenibacillus taiwanensis]
MLVSTTERVANAEIAETLGTAFGVVVRARGIGGDIMASLKGLVGGEVKQYTQMIEDARRQAMDRMIQNAHAMGGDAVIMMRFDSGDIGQNMSEIVAYGTVVRLRPVNY